MKIYLISILACVVLACAFTEAQTIEYVNSALWTGAVDVQTVDNCAYCVFSNGLAVIDITESDNPILIRESYLRGTGNTITLIDNTAFISDGDAGLYIIDIAEPANPAIISNVDTPGYANDLFIADHYALIADGDSGWVIIDITDLTSPEIVSEVLTPDYASGVFVSGNYAFITTFQAGLLIYDINDIHNPVHISTYGQGSSFMDIHIEGEQAFLADFSHELVIIDISNAFDPAFVGSCTTSYCPYGISIADNIAYVGCSFGGIDIIDISDPSNPYLRRNYDDFGTIWNLWISDSMGYLPDYEGGFRIVNLCDPDSLAELGVYETVSIVFDVELQGDYAYLACGRSGLRILNVSDPYNLIWVGEYDDPYFIFECYNIYVSGNFVYWVDCGRLIIISIENPQSPYLVSETYTEASSLQMWVHGNYAYLSDSSGDLLIYDITDPHNPVPVSTFYYAFVSDIYVNDEFAFSSGFPELGIIDVSDPYNPWLRGSYSGSDYSRGVYVRGDFAYLACRDSDLKIVDFSLPGRPGLVGSLDLPYESNIEKLAVQGNYAYLANQYFGLDIVNIANPELPELTDQYRTPGTTRNIALQDEYVYLADTRSLMILRHDQVGVDDTTSFIPNEFSLCQNYPNPFNASTRISFSLPEPADVSLDIYDILGRKTESLLHCYLPAGDHSIVWHAEDLPTGVYFYRIAAGHWQQSRKVLLVK